MAGINMLALDFIKCQHSDEARFFLFFSVSTI